MQTRIRCFAWLIVFLTLAATTHLLTADSQGTLGNASRLTAAASADVRSPEQLSPLFQQRKIIEAQLKTAKSEEEVQNIVRLLETLDKQIDAVGGQLYCSKSRLFWYTDLEQAKLVAKKTGEPILSLRMLGKLTDELSCANSRFFRTTLYANEQVSQIMREKFVLHWESVRPVPTLTVDFGDGRKLVRTVTGNSIHYVLTPDGEVVDALPGLFGPAMFLRLLNRAETEARHVASLPANSRSAAIVMFHNRCLLQINESWSQDLERISAANGNAAEALRSAEQKLLVPQQLPVQAAAAPAAERAARIAMPKMRVETMLVANLTGRPASFQRDVDLDQRTTETLWQQLAILHAEDAKLDGSSEQLIASEHPTATQAAEVAITKLRVETPLVRMFRELQTSIAQDSIRNQYLLHRKIHAWFAAGQAPGDLRQLNEKVYAELFLTPSSDPWLGLVPASTYTGLKDNGIVK